MATEFRRETEKSKQHGHMNQRHQNSDLCFVCLTSPEKFITYILLLIKGHK